MTEKKPLVLVDGSSYLFRAFYALPPLTNSKGKPTGAIYGVLNMLKKLLNDYHPEYVAVVFDPKGKTFRYDLYPEYKANRTKMPDDLRDQIAPLFEAIKALGLPLVMVEGFEADDVIGTLALTAEKEGFSTLISTGDKDLAQLVNEKVTLINTMSDTLLNREGVINKFGVPPERMIDYLALVGDSSDNIPGIPKVGPKTAVKWLSEYGSLENIIQNGDKITGKVGENLRENLELLKLSQELVTIKTDVNVGVDFHTLTRHAPDKSALIEIFKELEFRKWLETLQSEASEKAVSARKYHTITDKADFAHWLEKLSKSPYFSFDTETTSLNPFDAELVGISFSDGAFHAAYVPLVHDYPDAPAQLSRDFVLQEIKKLLEDPSKTVIGQNLKYDEQVLMKYGIEFKASNFDTMLESYVLNSTMSRHDMGSLAMKYLGERTIPFEEIAGKGAKMVTFNQIPIEIAANYASEDADITLRLHEKLWPEISAAPGLLRVFTEIEMPLVPVLAKIESIGVLIDTEKLKIQSAELGLRIHSLEEKVYEIAGEVFNLGSPKQLQTILYEKLKLPIKKKTPTGQPSTAEDVLSELAHDYPLPKYILEYRSLSKLKSTYTDALPLQIHPVNLRVHTSYNQAVTATGRLSSTEPNLQNIPVRTEEGRKIRQAFIAPPHYKLLSADYSQVELRIMAHLSQDPGLLMSFENGLDVHVATAAEVFGVSLASVTSDQRRHAKAINFGLMYGMSSFGLSQQLNIDTKSAKEYIDTYFARYPKVHEYMEKSREIAAKQGYVETLFGRRLYVPEINVANLQRRRAAERAAINAPLQGTAADIIKLAMINIDQWLTETQAKAKMIMQVHDELVFEIPENEEAYFVENIKNRMENAVKLSVPLLVDVGVGNNWDEAH
jgi:DNA polymerase-1